MTDMLQTAVEWLDAERKAHLSRDVTYHRGANSVTVGATLGATSLEVMDDGGVTVRTNQMDFIVSAADLVLAGVLVTPTVGDRIVLIVGAVTKTFEVLPMPGSGEHYRTSDPAGTTLRIHARLIGEA